jgi:hypothetical protein
MGHRNVGLIIGVGVDELDAVDVDAVAGDVE